VVGPSVKQTSSIWLHPCYVHSQSWYFCQKISDWTKTLVV